MKARRRAVARAAGAAACAALLTGVPAHAQQAAARFRTVVVDASRVASFGSPALAEQLRGEVAQQVRQEFADLLAPSDARAPTLVVRIDSISLGASAETTMSTEGNSKDYLEGAGIVSAGGQVLSTTPILSVLNPGYSGAWYAPDIEARRVVSISHHFAYWLRREMGL